MKAIGRYDRWNLELSFCSQRPVGFGGINLLVRELGHDNSSMLYSILGDMDATFTMKSIHPFVDMHWKDNVVVGAKFGYSHIVVI